MEDNEECNISHTLFAIIDGRNLNSNIEILKITELSLNYDLDIIAKDKCGYIPIQLLISSDIMSETKRKVLKLFLHLWRFKTTEYKVSRIQIILSKISYLILEKYLKQ